MISKKEIIEKVGVLLKELTDKFEYISDAGREVNPLEFQLFEINAAYFAEHANLLRKLEEEESRSHAEVEEHAETHEKVLEEVEHTELKNIEQIASAEKEGEPEKEPELEEEPEKEEPEIKESSKDPIIFTPVTNHEPIKEEDLDSQETVEEIPEQNNNAGISENKVVSSNTNSESNAVSSEKEQVKEQNQREPVFEPAKEVTHEVVIEEKTLNVPNNERPMSLNERLSEQRKAMDAEKKHLDSPRRIKDIKSGINLNDKLLFIKDLFNGYSLAYSEAIELLNRFESFEDADRFLKANYAQKNNWDSKQASVEKLYAILRQRYG